MRVYEDAPTLATTFNTCPITRTLLRNAIHLRTVEILPAIILFLTTAANRFGMGVKVFDMFGEPV